MYLIALCDDEAAELDKVENMLRSYQKQNVECDFQVERFQSAEELLSIAREKGYMPDVLFMDIYMDGKLGTQAARELREMGNNCQIIFLTTSKEHALEAFRVDAVQYLVKPVLIGQLFPVLERVLREVDKEQERYLLLRISGCVQRVALHRIIYCEAQRKVQHVYLEDGQPLELRITMSKLYEMLSGHPEFVKLGIAYIVNLEHIERLSAQSIQMDNGVTIYLPRGSYQPLKELYFEYYCGGDGDGGIDNKRDQ